MIYSGHARKALPPSSAWTGVGLGNTLTLAQLVGSGRIPEQGEQHNVDGPLWKTLYGILDGRPTDWASLTSYAWKAVRRRHRLPTASHQTSTAA